MDPDLQPFLRVVPPDLECLHSFQLNDAVTCLCVSPDGDLVAAGSFENAIHVLDQHLQPVLQLSGHAGGTNSIQFASSDVLVSAGEDGHAAVWDCRTGECRARLECEGKAADKCVSAPHKHEACSVTSWISHY